jgi:hypothetical protein
MVAAIGLLILAFITAANAKTCSSTAIRVENADRTSFKDITVKGFECAFDIRNSTNTLFENVKTFFK